jgi:AMIN domain-containing protein
VIRINLVRSKEQAARPAKSLVSPREAITGAVLLVAAFGMLFYLASREKPAATPAPEAPPQIAKAEPVVKAPPEPKVEEPPPPPPKPAALPPPARAAAGCLVNEIRVQKAGGNLAVLIQTTAEVKYISFELSRPDRIAVDVFGCVAVVPRAQASQAVEDPVVQRVRANQFRPDVYRVVLDVSAMPRYQIRAIDKGLEIRVLGKKP